MRVETRAGEAFADGIRQTVEGIEEEARERIEDAVRACVRFTADPDRHGELMTARDGEWLSFDDVVAAVKRGAW
jgi:predicted NAD/FAD-binding protein